MRLLNKPEHKAEQKRQNINQKERLRARFENGDPFLRRTIFGNIKLTSLVIQSAGETRFAYTSTPLPGSVGEVAVQT